MDSDWSVIWPRGRRGEDNSLSQIIRHGDAVTQGNLRGFEAPRRTQPRLFPFTRTLPPPKQKYCSDFLLLLLLLRLLLTFFLKKLTLTDASSSQRGAEELKRGSSRLCVLGRDRQTDRAAPSVCEPPEQLTNQSAWATSVKLYRVTAVIISGNCRQQRVDGEERKKVGQMQLWTSFKWLYYI